MCKCIGKYVRPKQDLPKFLFYKRGVNTVMKPPQSEYFVFSTSGDGNWGEFVCHKMQIPQRKDYNGPSIAVDFIWSKKQNCGLGTAIIDFIKNLSKRTGCNGHVILFADGFVNPNRIPHPFYRKQGFSSLNRKTDNQIDSFIKQKTPATTKDLPSMLMYYPPIKEKENFLKRFFKTIQRIL